ncbi:TIGR04168 family protein [Geminocystis sp. NIES-3709]|uniref:TIGR04168 family protein n=1 Tax=Geminocystis sp. NIES-3709 TaxID=1617448 RepID=UPI0005FC72A1|nr:TIGR04168 family protein [Geminocystis sp. NIES-3709]BAQ63358.1 metallophosphoesterase [Geminocystis sp. NIES-3709]
MRKTSIKIAVIGDVHENWNDYDSEALEFLAVDLALFVGDFGNESIKVVENIANLTIPKAIILGNHDAWFTATEWGRKKCPYDQTLEDRVQKQLDLLGITHVGYSSLDFPPLELSVVGSRPFTWGGSKWKYSDFYQHRYGVNSFEESTAKIVDGVRKTSFDHIIFIGHNGPFGLGSNPEDTCGRDWNPLGGDYGDPDFQSAIEISRNLGKKVSLVTFGHMHHALRHTKERLRTIVNRDKHDTIYLNAASTPRIQEINGKKVHKFSLVTLNQEKIMKISLISIDETMKIVENQIILESPDF